MGIPQLIRSDTIECNRVFHDMGLNQRRYPSALATVTVASGGRVYAYASTVDNRTGDQTFIPAESRVNGMKRFLIFQTGDPFLPAQVRLGVW